MPAIRIENLGKRYVVNHEARGGYRTLRETLVDAAAAPLRRLRGERSSTREHFWALKDVNLEVQPGEVVGIIGRNGAGKSTLLKILSQITRPTTGRIRLSGRVGSLLEVGTGFHPELTGRENIYLNGSILGMSRREIARKFDEIIAFAEIEQFLDTPVKRYSSGMYVRLAFAVAAHLEPEILIVDEVLAVGDASFQSKCTSKLREIAESGRTILFVSHNLVVVERLCSKVALVERGRVSELGPAAQQVQRYLAQSVRSAQHTVDLTQHPSRRSHCEPILTCLQISSGGQPGAAVRMGAPLRLDISYRVPWPPSDLRIGVVIEDMYGCKIAAMSPTFQHPAVLKRPPRSGTLSAVVPELTLVAGQYRINLYAHCDGRDDALEPAGALEVEAADVYGALCTIDRSIASTYFPCSWSLA